MKKISFILVAVAAVLMASCGAKAPKASLENDVDTICYGIGVVEGGNVMRSVFADSEVGGMGIDSAYIDEFIKGLLDGANLDGSDKQKAYFAGVSMGNQMGNQVEQYLKYSIYGANADSTATVSTKDFFAGLIATLKDNSNALGKTPEEVQGLLREKVEAVKADVLSKSYGEYKKQNEEYLEKVAKEDSIQTLGEGVLYKVLVEGTGDIPTTADRVKVHYEGKTIDGNVFDSSYKHGEPIEFGVTQVIKGWTEALTHMPVGSKWVIYIPQEAAYGAQEGGLIKPFSTLIFTVELLDIVK